MDDNYLSSGDASQKLFGKISPRRKPGGRFQKFTPQLVVWGSFVVMLFVIILLTQYTLRNSLRQLGILADDKEFSLSQEDINAIRENINKLGNPDDVAVTFKYSTVFERDVIFEQDIVAPNVLYGLLPGAGISITGDPQNPIISVTDLPEEGVTRIENINGDVDLEAGDNVTITTDGNKIRISSKTFSSPSQLTESEVEAFIFDGDNTGILSSGTLGLSSLSYDGSLPSAALAGNYSGITGVGTLNGLIVSGSASFGSTATFGSGVVVGNDFISEFIGNGITINAGTVSVALQTGSGLEADASGISLIRSCDGGEVLSWSGSEWECAVVGGVGGSISKTGSPESGFVTFWSGTSAITGESNMYYDTSTNRLGIGTTAPSAPLEVAGAAIVDSLTLNANSGTALNISGASFTTDIMLQNGETIHNDTNGVITFGGADILVEGNDILDLTGTHGITLGETTIFTNATSEFFGTSTIDATSLATLITAASLDMNSTTSLTLGDNASLYGSNIANGDITIEGTSNATKTTSYVILQPGTGNVGIGTTAPSTKLDIAGTLRATGLATFGAGINVNSETFTDLTGTGLQNNAGVLQLSASGVVSGTYGNSANVPIISVDSYGRIIGISETVIPGGYANWLLNAGGNVTTINTGTTVSFTGSTGLGVSNSSGAITLYNSGVTSLAGTTNQITASGATGAITLSLPQNIHTGATVQFAGVTVGGDTITEFMGNGLTVASNTLQVKLASSSGVGLTASYSGLELGSSGLGLLSGCGDTQILIWNSATSTWRCSTIGGAGGIDATGSPLGGYITYWSDGNTVTGESALFYDASNDRVGIGTTAPGQTLTVQGTFGILEGGASPQYHTIFQGGDQAGNITYTLPTALGSGGYVLTTDGSGGLSWQSVTGGIVGAGDISAVGNITSGDAFTSGTPGSQLYFGSGGFAGLGTAAARIQFVDAATDAIGLVGGNVGVGTTNPSRTLDVVGTLGVSSTATFSGGISINGDYITDLTGTGLSNAGGALGLSTTGVTAGTYGTSTNVPVISIDAYGRVTSASTIAIPDGYENWLLNAGGNVTTINTGTTVSFTGSTGLGVSNSSGAITLYNSGVTSLAGTTNQITASGATGAITLSLPQNIHTGATVQFAGVTVGGDTITEFMGNGLTVASNTLQVKLASSSGVGLTASYSGLELGSSGLGLLSGCGDTQILTWNSATSTWRCSTIGGAGGIDATGSPLGGYITYWSDGNTVTGESALFYDASNDRVGIGTTAPGYSLDISGTLRATGLATFDSGVQVNSETITDFSGLGLSVASGSLRLATSGVTAGTYGSGSLAPVISVDATGRITNVSEAAIPGGYENWLLNAGGSVTAINSGTTVSFTGSTGLGVSNSSGAITLYNSGVTSLAGTTNQITASAATGAVTLSLPQNIHTGATVQFTGLTVGGDTITEFMGNGLTVSSNTLSLRLASGSGLEFSSGAVSMLRSCGTNEVLAWNGSAWACTSISGVGGLTKTGSPNSGYLTFWSGTNTLTGVSALYTDGTNIGIGTTAPAARLDVAGTSWLRGGTGATGLYVNSSGNVGIGTTSPLNKLTIYDTNNQVALGTSSSVVNYLSTSGVNGDFALYNSVLSGNLLSQVANTGFLTVRGGISAGGIVEGSNDFGGTLNIHYLNNADDIQNVLTLSHRDGISGSAGQGTGILIQGHDSGGNLDSLARLTGVWTDATNTSEDSALGFEVRAAGGGLVEAMRIVSGNVGIGTTNPTYKLDVVGSVGISTTAVIGGGISLNGDYITDLTGTGLSNAGGSLGLSTTGVTAGTYGSASSVPVVSVDAYGRINTISTAAIAGGYQNWILNAAGSAQTISTGSTVSFTGSTGLGLSHSAGSITLYNSGVTSIAGTTNQITASAATGAVTLSLPQNIHTGATVQFAQLGIGATTNGVGLNVSSTAWLRGGTGDTGLFVNSSGNVGIGTTNPSSPFELITQTPTYEGANYYNGQTAFIHGNFEYAGVDNDYNNLFSNIRVGSTTNNSEIISALAGSIFVPSDNTANHGQIFGINTRVSHEGSGTVTNARGMLVDARNTTGTITNFQGIRTQLTNTALVSNFYGIEVSSLTNTSGTISNTYGIYVGDITSGTQTNTPFSFYASDSNAYNYFAGNVGIGNTNPTYKLDVNGAVGIGTTAVIGGGISLNGDYITDLTGTGLSNAGGTLGLSTTGVVAGTYGSSTNIPVVSVDAYGRINSVTNQAVSFDNYGSWVATNGITPATITSGSTVTFTGGTGIGVSSSGSTFTFHNSGVTSIAGTTNQITASAATGAVTLSLPQNIHTGATVQFAQLGIGATTSGVGLNVSNTAWLRGGTGATGLFVNSSGNVGIGTTNPGAALNMVNAGAADLDILLDNGTAQGIFEVQTNNVVRLGSVTNHSFEFVTNNATRFKVSNTGDIGISDSTPDGIFEISGSAGASDLFLVSSDDDTDGNRFIIKNSGNVGIGTTNPTYKLDVVGSVGISTTAVIGGGISLGGDYISDFIGSGLTSSSNVLGIKLAATAGSGITASASGLQVDGSGLRMLSGCSSSQYLSWNGSAWICTTMSAGGDVTKSGTPPTGSIAYWDGPSSITGNSALFTDGSNIGIGTTAPASALDVNGAILANSLTLDANTGTALNISGTSFATDILLQNGETIDNDVNGVINFGGADIQIGGNDILDSAGISRVNLGSTTTFTNSTTTFSGTSTITASSLATLTTAASLNMSSTTGLTLGDDATLYGSDTANGDLTLQGTSNATKTSSYVLLQPGSGNVGIGTTAPASKLDVAGGYVTLDNGDFSASRGIRFRNTTDTTTPTGGGMYFANNNILYLQAGTANSITFRKNDGNAYAEFGYNNNKTSLNIPTGGLIRPYEADSQTALQIATYNGSTPYVNFDSTNQRVGIGTTTPSYKLDVVSTSTTGILNLTGNSITSGTGVNLSLNALSTGTGFNILSTSTAFTTGRLMNLDWSPSSTATATGDLLRLNIGPNGTLTGNLLALYNNGSELFKVSTSKITSAIPHEFTASGDVSVANDLIFTDQVANTIQTYGPLTIESGEVFENQNLTLRTFGTGNMVFELGGSGDTVIFDGSTGNVGIGVTSTLDVLHVGGDIRIGTGTTGCVKDADGTTLAGSCSSDANLKTNITSMHSLLDKFIKLNPVTYQWNETAAEVYKYGTSETQIGLIAQNVESVFPELVTVDTNGYRQVNFSALPIYTMQALKELKLSTDGDFTDLKSQLNEIDKSIVTQTEFDGLQGDVEVLKQQYDNLSESMEELLADVDINEIKSLVPAVEELKLRAQLADDKMASMSARISFLEENLLNSSGAAVLGATSDGSLATTSATLSSLAVTGETNLYDVGISGTINAGLLTINGFDDSLEEPAVTINTIGGPLKIQPLRLESVDFMDGKVSIDTQGNMKVLGRLIADVVRTKKLEIVEPVEATEPTPNTTEQKSIGESTLPAGESEIIIETPSVTEASRIYVTFNGEYGPATRYWIAEKIKGTSFTIKLDAAVDADVDFSWLIVN